MRYSFSEKKCIQINYHYELNFLIPFFRGGLQKKIKDQCMLRRQSLKNMIKKLRFNKYNNQTYSSLIDICHYI